MSITSPDMDDVNYAQALEECHRRHWPLSRVDEVLAEAERELDRRAEEPVEPWEKACMVLLAALFLLALAVD